jgi:antitoxin MazE
METKIQKWGNSLGIRIPSVIIKGLLLKNGSSVDIVEESDQIVIKPKRGESLEEMLSSISNENLHSEIDFGIQEGHEIW